MAIAIKPPLPERIPVPADQIPVAPESGLVIRKRTASAAPLASHQVPSSSGAMLPLSSGLPVPAASRASDVSGLPGVSGASVIGVRDVSGVPGASGEGVTGMRDVSGVAGVPAVPVVIKPRSSSPTGRTPSGAMPSIGLRGVPADMSDLALKSPTPPLALPVVDADAMNVELERRSTTPPLAMPVVDADVTISFEPTPLPVAALPLSDRDTIIDATLSARAAVATAAAASNSDDVATAAAASNRDDVASAAAAPDSDDTAADVERADSLEDLLRTEPRAKPPIPSTNAGTPHPLVGKLSYAVANAMLTSIGISATREDGTHCQVVWESIIGIIARRLPYEPPHDGTTFVDLISTAGSTLRFLPWTMIEGAPVFGEGEDRARALVQLIAMRCLDAKLDSWTKVFSDGAGHAAQLPNAKTLAAHDERLA
jgi:hypothetical protein